MKMHLKFRILFCLAAFLILIPPLYIFYHIDEQKNLLYEKIIIEKEKINSLEKLKKNAQQASKKILVLEKDHAKELASLKENKLESLFYASQLIGKHQLILVKSTVGDDQYIKITLGGNLDNFSGFLREFVRSQKVLHLKSMAITTDPSLTFEMIWEVPTF